MLSSSVNDAGWRGKFAGIALLFALFAVIWFAAAALGSRFGLWSWQFGLGTMVGNVTAGWGRYILGASAMLAVLALIFALISAPRLRPTMLALAAILITLFAGGRWIGFQLTALSLPPIHDIQTDWDDPILFSSDLMSLRTAAGATNPVEPHPTVPQGVEARWPGYGGKTVAEAQESAEQDPALAGKDADEKPYPPIETLTTNAGRDVVMKTAESLMRQRGWAIVTADAETGRLEATHTSRWFGFKDDVALRVRETANGTEVDMRSVSRVGLSDLGANARRVSAFLTDLERELRTPPD